MTTVVPGFRFSTVSAGIRKDGRIDVALAVADAPAVVAGVFTRNQVRAAPVLLAMDRTRAGVARAILVNSGCANACTGEPGLAAARDSTAAIASALGVSAESVLPASTGVIGAVLPSNRIVEKAQELVDGLSASKSSDFATAILTTDRWQKVASTTIRRGDAQATLLAIGKGAGMMHPDVGPPQATMLVFLFTDAKVERNELERALVLASDATFNCCSVDGDTSTNDSVFALASGVSGLSLSAAELGPAFSEVCEVLARSMVADGEGANHEIEIRVRGLASPEAARTVARTVATSLLVKTALFGEDANWGRLLAAAGRAGVEFDANRAGIRVGEVQIVENGLGLGKSAELQANQILKSKSYAIELTLGSGPGSARYLTSDLGHGYIDVNAGYRS
jgi:glutamate N-acetyltransferase/amino-acid N-acetyltransferase